MTLSQAEQLLYNHLMSFSSPEVKAENIIFENSPIFTAPKNELWCRVYVDYANSRIVGMGNQPCKRNFGMIQIQCFAPLATSTTTITKLCEDWDRHLQNYNESHLEIYLVHAPSRIDDPNFLGRIIRAEFRVN